MKVSALRFYTPINGPTGYVSFGMGLAEELNKTTNLALYPLDGIRGDPYKVMSKQLVESIQMSEVTPRNVPAIILSMGGRQEFFRATGNPLIGYNMWESDKPPAYFVNALKEMDEVWVPSTWGAKCYQEAGVEKAVSMPGGVNHYLFNEMAPKVKELAKTNKFRFIALGKWERRKGYDLLLKAWTETFTRKDNVELLLVAHNIFEPGFEINEKVIQLGLDLRDSPNMVMFKQPINRNQDIASLLSTADCGVFPTRGEGWNMPLIEAMSTGLPTIVTNWGGHTEFVSKDTNYLLDYEMVPAVNDPMWQKNFDGSNWAEPNYDQLCEQLRYVYEHQDEAAKIGQAAAKHVQDNYTWGHAARRVMTRLKEM